MIELVVCDAVANRLSFYNAAEGDSWRQEATARNVMWGFWMDCRKWLDAQGLYREFMARGGYLI